MKFSPEDGDIMFLPYVAVCEYTWRRSFKEYIDVFTAVRYSDLK
jgi:hypothetical protein